MSNKVYLDGLLVDWGASLFNQSSIKKAKSAPKSALTGLVPKSRKSSKMTGGTKSQDMDATVVRAKLRAVVKRSPEVMVKISGGGSGMKEIKAHFDYISRNGQIDLETHDGEVVTGRDEVQLLRDAWQYGDYQEVPELGTKRQAFNIVLSMPEGTDPVALARAARDFAASEFNGHQYAMAVHTYETDPDPQPARHPHVHLVVKAESMDGIRLNPRKADLQRWREGFAEALREHGIDAAATKRQTRLNRTRGEKYSVREMKKRGEALDEVGKSKAGSERIEKAKAAERTVLNSYVQIAKALATSDDVEDRKLAVALVERLREEDDRDKSRKRDQGLER